MDEGMFDTDSFVLMMKFFTDLDKIHRCTNDESPESLSMSPLLEPSTARWFFNDGDTGQVVRT